MDRLVQEDETNIEISRGEGWLEDLNLSLVPASVEQYFSLNLMCLGTLLRSPTCADKWSCT